MAHKKIRLQFNAGVDSEIKLYTNRGQLGFGSTWEVLLLVSIQQLVIFPQSSNACVYHAAAAAECRTCTCNHHYDDYNDIAKADYKLGATI